MKSHLSAAFAFAALAISSHAVVIYDEASSGDLSGDGPTPTVLGAFTPGTNSVTGSMGGSPIDRDIFTFSIGAGQQLTAINLESYSVATGSAGGGSFFTAGTGSTSGAPSTAGSFGFAITSTPGPLFSSDLPAGPGDYTMWIQETAGGTIDYSVSFTVVPEPSILMLGSLCGLLAVVRRRR